jgi:hypothetical protein
MCRPGKHIQQPVRDVDSCFNLLESQITSCIIDASQEERVTLISILVCIVPNSTMMFVHLSVNVMVMDGYKHH